MEWTVQPKGYAPLEHIHLNQEKIFHVKSGELKILINKEEYIIKAGENITVPKGIRHIASNNKEEVLIAAWSINPAWVITNLCSDLRALQMIVSLIKKEA